MHFVVEGNIDGHENMRRDCLLLKSAEAGVCSARIYEWDGPWVSLGRFQSATRDLLAADSINWTQRPTGGKAVLHGHDITVTIAVALSVLNADQRKLRQHYRVVISPLVRALARAGLNAALAENTVFKPLNPQTSDCFHHISPNDVLATDNGEKLVGCALRVTKDALLAQCSIPFTQPLIAPETVFLNAATGRAAIDRDRLLHALQTELSDFLT